LWISLYVGLGGILLVWLRYLDVYLVRDIFAIRPCL
jgi:hypothetical protein